MALMIETEPMDYRCLGRTGLRVNLLCPGPMNFRPATEEAHAPPTPHSRTRFAVP